MWGIPLPETNRPANESACSAAAGELYRHWDELKCYPLSWSLIDRDEEKLVRIFHFFCSMRDLQQADAVEKVQPLLQKRLESRWNNEVVALPKDVRESVENLSNAQVAEIERLKELVEPAFELFVTASLVSHRMLYMTADLFEVINSFDLVRLQRGDFEPNGAAFFLWAEFGLLAMQLECDVEVWRKTLPVLFRCERILALCWGKPRFGFIPSCRVMDFYSNKEFEAIHPCVATSIPKTSATSLGELNVEAAACAKFAFPGEFGSSVGEC